ncbi:glycosyl hydrolase 108 family protein [Xanthomonas oryzae]|uniref:glycosyl hydrolase 108 family protein n=1 Tax=Xanthomonas oryzae TaxID=347 RepID=UPI003CCFA2FB
MLSHEGGYVNDPRDPGGETQWGISKRAYPELNIRALTRDQAIEIYRRDYWGARAGRQASSRGRIPGAGCCGQPRSWYGHPLAAACCRCG